MKHFLLFLTFTALTACSGKSPQSSPPTPAQEAANAAGALKILTTECPAYVGGIKDLQAISNAIAKQEKLAVSLGATKADLERARDKQKGKNYGKTVSVGKAEACVDLASDVVQFL